MTILRPHMPKGLICSLGTIEVELDILNRVYIFYLKPYGVIYKCTMEQVSCEDPEWRQGLCDAVDLLRTFG
jgi:hypothetical protein